MLSLEELSGSQAAERLIQDIKKPKTLIQVLKLRIENSDNEYLRQDPLLDYLKKVDELYEKISHRLSHLSTCMTKF